MNSWENFEKTQFLDLKQERNVGAKNNTQYNFTFDETLLIFLIVNKIKLHL